MQDLTFDPKSAIFAPHMLRIVKHIATVALCLLVICGAVGTHFYVFVCSHNHHAAQLALTADHQGCCSHGHDAGTECHHHGDGVASFDDEASCCQTSSQVLSVSNFEVSHLLKLSKIATLSVVVNFLFDNALCVSEDASRIAYSSFVHSPQSPDIFSFGQLRL